MKINLRPTLQRLMFVLSLSSLFSAQALSQATLPTDLKWETNDTDPVYSSEKAVKGGEARVAMSTFPSTLRRIGPDANSSALYLAQNDWTMSLIGVHPGTEKPFPLLATHWAYGKDGKSIYYKLNKNAKWSDGKPLTANDFKFTLEFMLSKNIMAPWYNNFYGENFDSVNVFDDHTLSIVLKKEKPRIYIYADLPPTPRHFYNGVVDKDFVKKFNWTVVPVPGPYQITKVEKGKNIVISRVKNWWGENERFFKNRFNVDKITFQVVRETTVEYEWFKSGKLDFFAPSEPSYWFDRAKDDIYEKGYVERMMFYNDTARPSFGFWLNQAAPLLADKNVRLGIQHSMNFDKLIQTILRKEWVRLNTTAEGFSKYTHPTIKARAFDIKKAEEYFVTAGFTTKGPDGIRMKGDQRLSVSLTYSSEDWNQRLAVLREEAKKTGLDLQLRFLDWSAATKLYDGKKHEAAFMGFGTGIFPEYFQAWNSKQEDNLTSTNIASLDKMIDDYNNATDEPQKIKLSHAISQIIYDEGAFIPSLAKDWTRVAYWRWWNFPETPGTKQTASLSALFDLSWGGLVWFDQAKKDETLAAQKSKKTFTRVDRVIETFRVKK